MFNIRISVEKKNKDPFMQGSILLHCPDFVYTSKTP